MYYFQVWAHRTKGFSFYFYQYLEVYRSVNYLYLYYPHALRCPQGQDNAPDINQPSHASQGRESHEEIPIEVIIKQQQDKKFIKQS
mgnify:CR=1 FL=1